MRFEFTYTADDLCEMAKGAALPREPNGPFNRAQRGLFGWVLFIALAVVLLITLQRRAGTVPPAGVPATAPSSAWTWQDIVVPLIPWLLIIGFIWFFVFRQIRKMSPQNVWKRETSMQQPKVLEISDAGVRLSDPLATTEWRWEAFSELVETPNLLLLRQTDNTFLIVPKRAVPPGQIDSLRFELNSHISTRGAFPVLPPKRS